MTDEKKRPGVFGSFIGGIVLTLALVIAVPVITSMILEPTITDLVKDVDLSTSVISLSSGTIGAILMFAVMMLFMYFLGGGAILRRYGVIGIFGLVAAYYLMGDIYGAVVPVIMVIILGTVSYLMDRRKNGKAQRLS